MMALCLCSNFHMCQLGAFPVLTIGVQYWTHVYTHINKCIRLLSAHRQISTACLLVYVFDLSSQIGTCAPRLQKIALAWVTHCRSPLTTWWLHPASASMWEWSHKVGVVKQIPGACLLAATPDKHMHLFSVYGCIKFCIKFVRACFVGGLDVISR